MALFSGDPRVASSSDAKKLKVDAVAWGEVSYVYEGTSVVLESEEAISYIKSKVELSEVENARAMKYILDNVIYAPINLRVSLLLLLIIIDLLILSYAIEYKPMLLYEFAIISKIFPLTYEESFLKSDK